MAEVTYVSVTWTAGDIITEAKLDSMVANQRAVDAMNNGIELAERSTPSTPGANKLHLYAKDKSGIPTLYSIGDDGVDYELSEGRPSFSFSLMGGLYAVASATPICIVHRPLTIIKAYAAVKTAPTGTTSTPIAGQSLVIDINKNGSTIWSTQANRLTIADGATTGNTSTFNTTALAEGDNLTLDIDFVGSTVAGADLTVLLRCK